jgi:hypothetical protein
VSFLKVAVDIVAKNPPMTLCALGSLGILFGAMMNSPFLLQNGWLLVILGAILQIIYLILRFL